MASPVIVCATEPSESAGLGLAGDLGRWNMRWMIVCFSLSLAGCTPSQELQRADDSRLFDMKVRCADVGRKQHDEAWSSARTGEIPASPQFNYERSSNTCVMLSGYDNPSDKIHVRYIVDLLTNVELARHARFDGDQLALSAEEFQRRVDQFWPSAR